MSESHRGPGSSEGLAEVRHWQRYSRLSNEDRDFLISQARERITDPVKRRQAELWIKNRYRKHADGAGLAKRWGLTLPSESRHEAEGDRR